MKAAFYHSIIEMLVAFWLAGVVVYLVLREPHDDLQCQVGWSGHFCLPLVPMFCLATVFWIPAWGMILHGLGSTVHLLDLPRDRPVSRIWLMFGAAAMVTPLIFIA